MSQRDATLPGGLVAVSRVLGLISDTMGNINDAVSHYGRALRLCRAAGYWPEVAWTCYDLAGSLGGRDAARDREREALLLDEASAISRRLDIGPLMDKAESRSGNLASRAVAVRRYPDGLTAGEIEVLRLIAQGSTNQEIALALVISASTVAHHVANIFNKTGVTNRTGAATYAGRHDLV